MKNYAEEPEFVAANRIRERYVLVLGIVVLCLCAVVLGFGWILWHEADAEVEAVSVLSEIADLPPLSSGGSDIDGLEGDLVESVRQVEPNWDSVEAEAGNPATMWIQVPNRGIDFPVAQWTDNNYGLHHDIYGNYSWAGVFLDCDADPDGFNKVVYGHTLYGGGMFTDLARSRYQSEFDTIGLVRYSSPGRGWIDMRAIASIDVPASDTSIRKFVFEPSDPDVANAVASMLDGKQRAGEANVCVDAFGQDGDGRRYVANASDLDSSRSVMVGDGMYYELTEEDMAACRVAASKVTFRRWLADMVSRADSSVVDARNAAMQADECVVLACCSWPFHNTRTLVICVPC